MKNKKEEDENDNDKQEEVGVDNWTDRPDYDEDDEPNE